MKYVLCLLLAGCAGAPVRMSDVRFVGVEEKPTVIAFQKSRPTVTATERGGVITLK
jgi:hypothetical protein